MGTSRNAIETQVDQYVLFQVNNAGVSMGGGADTDEDTFERNWQKTVDINLTGM